ncbi:Coiled-coil domain-containing protein 91 [Exaiptasia diaphana]|nr:Coiled-coil domain-containing protein 91 [Exaiptasia diaphana]
MAENENWASFPPPNANDNDDDDWADFGGFETATPVADPQPGNNATGLISWAALSTVPQATTETGLPSQPATTFVEQSPWSATFQSEGPGDILPNTTEVVDLSLSPSNFESISTANSNGQEQLTELTKELNHQREERDRASQLADDLKTKLSLAEQEKMKFKKDLEELTNKNHLLEMESTETKEMLKIQKQTYADLQEEHTKQIKEIRQAGHDALGIIVEEYKELCKQAVLEQQEKSQAELHLFLENERQKFKETVLQQQESFEKSLSEERANNEERIKDVLQAEQEKHKLLLESSVSKAQEEMKSEIMSIAEKTTEEGKIAVKEAVAKERELHQKAMEDMKTLLQEEREKFKISLEEALFKEKEKSKSC